MLRQTFCHIPTITPKTESVLWQSGVRTWHDQHLLRKGILSSSKQAKIVEYLETSQHHLSKNDAAFFSTLLPANQHWRLYPEFRHSVAYIDIETTGMASSSEDHITSIAMYDGKEIRYYVHGQNMQDFKHDIRNYSLIVTYNGKCFDIPFIQRYFNITIEAAHIDLRYVLKSLGYRGGLKGCERQLGIDRQGLEELNGYYAVLLWREYRRTGNLSALETLLAYNIADAVNLETLLVLTYNLKLAATPFQRELTLDAPAIPANPFSAHQETIRQIRWKYFGWMEEMANRWKTGK